MVARHQASHLVALRRPPAARAPLLGVRGARWGGRAEAAQLHAAALATLRDELGAEADALRASARAGAVEAEAALVHAQTKAARALGAAAEREEQLNAESEERPLGGV